MKRHLTLLIVMHFPLVSLAGDRPGYYEDRILRKGSELADWCHAEAVDRYKHKGYFTYQWTGSHGSYGEHLYANGKLRVHGDDVTVSCTAIQQSRAIGATITIDDPELSDPLARKDVRPSGR